MDMLQLNKVSLESFCLTKLYIWGCG